MLSAFNDRDNVIKALDGGALGFIPKTGSRDVLVSALRLVLAGGVYIPPDILNRTSASGRAGPGQPAGASRRPSPAELGLTGRQVDVLALMMQGKSNKLICRALDLGRADREEPRVGDPQGPGRQQPDRGGAGGRGFGLGVAARNAG